MIVYPAAQVVLAAAALVLAVAILLLIQRRGFGRASLKAGPVELDFEAVKKIDDVHAELKPNGGSSLRDAVDRIERKVDGQTGVLDDLSRRVEALESKVA